MLETFAALLLVAALCWLLRWCWRTWSAAGRRAQQLENTAAVEHTVQHTCALHGLFDEADAVVPGPDGNQCPQCYAEALYNTHATIPEDPAP